VTISLDSFVSSQLGHHQSIICPRSFLSSSSPPGVCDSYESVLLLVPLAWVELIIDGNSGRSRRHYIWAFVVLVRSHGMNAGDQEMRRI